MKKLMWIWGTVALSIGVALSASSHEGHDHNTRTWLFVGDTSGNLSIFEDIYLAPMPRVKTYQLTGLDLGEIVAANGKVFVAINTGLTGPAQGLPAGGFAIVNVPSLAIDDIVILESTLTGRASRPVHIYLDPEARYLWVNNDGPSGDNAVDSVFRVNVEPTSPEYLTSVEILIGDGHHKSAFSYPSPEQPNARRLMVTHNLSDRTISIIDNDPNSATFLQVIKTVGPGNATLPGTDYVPHGMAYSPISGHIYTGMTDPVDWAVTIIDTTSPDLSVTGIRAGLEPGQIPAAGGYTHAARGGSIIYIAGWKASEDGTTGTGWLSAIDATTNAVVAVIELGNLNASSFIENGQKLYLPSSSASMGNPISNVVAVVDINPASVGYHQVIREITVGEGGTHRKGAITADGQRAYIPDTCDTCVTISVIDTRTDTVVDTPVVEGLIPGEVGTVTIALE